MAEYEEKSFDELTEEPSQHRIEELRSKGTVAQSRELTGVIALLAVLTAVYFTSGKFIAEISEFMREVFTKDIQKPLDISDWRVFTDIGVRSFKLILFSFMPVAFSGVIVGILAAVSQVGFHISTDTLQPDFNRVDPISGFTKLASLKSLVEGFKSTLKFTVIIAAVILAVKSEILYIPESISFSMSQLLTYIGSIVTKIFWIAGVFLLGVGLFDYWIQWRRYRKQAMMTKSEAKKDLKEREGDPQIKARIRTIQRDAARKRMMKAVPKADVVITNPTHFAIAIVYNIEEGFAPKVVAKGADFLAERIKKIARENGVPTVENKPLARTLYKHVKVGQMIPRSLYQAVAEILAYVYRLKGKNIKPSSEKSI